MATDIPQAEIRPSQPRVQRPCATLRLIARAHWLSFASQLDLTSKGATQNRDNRYLTPSKSVVYLLMVALDGNLRSETKHSWAHSHLHGLKVNILNLGELRCLRKNTNLLQSQSRMINAVINR